MNTLQSAKKLPQSAPRQTEPYEAARLKIFNNVISKMLFSALTSHTSFRFDVNSFAWVMNFKWGFADKIIQIVKE